MQNGTLAFSRWLAALGIDWTKAWTALKGVRKFWSDYQAFKELNSRSADFWEIAPNYPCLTDCYRESGEARGHYFYQDLLVAQKIFRKQPRKHADLGSRVDGFVAHVASFRELEVLDLRLLSPSIPNVRFYKCDLLQLPPEFQQYCDSLSCLHVLEHIGLGRYGDSIDLLGHIKALDNLVKMLTRNGTLYLSVPFGRKRIEFNAHRIFDLAEFKELLQHRFKIVEFAWVDDGGDLHVAADLEAIATEGAKSRYALAIFELQKL
jgi:Caenorhabditis protein of unknown function, DUF268